jgi:hypothetical protein
LSWQQLCLAKPIFGHGERVPFIPSQKGISNKLQVERQRLRLADLFIADLGLGQYLPHDMTHYNPSIQPLQIDSANFKFLMDILF